MKSARRTIVLGTVAVLLALGVGINAAGSAADTAGVRLPDGSTLTLVAVADGTAATELQGAWWQEALYRLLPAPVRPLSGAREQLLPDSGPNAVACWLRRHNAPPDDPWEPRFWIVDEAGHEREAYQSEAPGEPIRVVLTPFPRRSPVIRVRVYGPEGPGSPAVGELTLPSPTPGPHPNWTAAPLPVKSRSGTLTVSLTDLRSGVPLPGQWSKEPGASATFAIGGGERPRDWEPAGLMTLTDATGNQNFSRIVSAESTKSGYRCRFTVGIWAWEPVWKLRLLLAPRGAPAAGTTWATPMMQLPEASARRTVGLKGSVPRTTFELDQVYAAGAVARPLVNRTPDFSPSHYAAIRAEVVGGAFAVRLVGGVDDRGRAIQVDHVPIVTVAPPVGTGTSTGPGPRTAAIRTGFTAVDFPFRVSPGARAVRLTFAAEPTRAVEFVAAPKPATALSGR